MKRDLRYLDYLADFTCSGKDCEDSCCIQWRIYLDQQTFEHYQTISDPGLQSVISSNVELIEVNRTAAHYGRINLTEERKCPFLTADNLCSLQCKLGTGALSQTCLTYPRVFNSVAGVLEGSAAISCPEVARKVLLCTEGIKIREKKLELDNRFALNRTIDSDGGQYQSECFLAIRNWVLQLVQDRSLEIEDRLTVLGLFCEKAEPVIRRGADRQIKELLDEFNRFQAKDELSEYLKDIPCNRNQQLAFLVEIAEEKMRRGTNIATFKEKHRLFLNAIKHKSGLFHQRTANIYQTYHDEFYQLFFKEKSHILENYLVNYLFLNLFPRDDAEPGSIIYAYARLVLNFALLRMYLTGIGGCQGGLTENSVVELIYSYGKAIEHDTGFLDDILVTMSNNHLLTVSQLLVLVRT